MRAAKCQLHAFYIWKRVDGYASCIPNTCQLNTLLLCNSDFLNIMHLVKEKALTWIDQSGDELCKLQNASGPAMYEDQWNCMQIMRSFVDEVEIYAVHRHLEMVQ